MKNNNVLNVRALRNSDINVKSSKNSNLDILYEFFYEIRSRFDFESTQLSLIGFDFDDFNFIRRIKLLEGCDFVEAFHEASLNPGKYGGKFCLLHHDLLGFHYLIF